MNQRIVLIVVTLFCASFIDSTYAADMITLRYGQDAASAGSLSSLPHTVAERKIVFVREGINLVVALNPGGTDRGSLPRSTRARLTPAKTRRPI